MQHELKLNAEYFDDVYYERKKCDVRSTVDRKFKVGDTIIFREWKPPVNPLIDGEYTGNVCSAVITHIIDDFRYCLPNTVILSIYIIYPDIVMESDYDYNEDMPF